MTLTHEQTNRLEALRIIASKEKDEDQLKYILKLTDIYKKEIGLTQKDGTKCLTH